MKKLVLIFSLVALSMFPTVTFGITFAIWETGMSINEVVGLAREEVRLAMLQAKKRLPIVS